MARTFNGSSGMITTLLSTLPDLRTYSAWVNITSAGESNGGRILSQLTGGGQFRFLISFGGGGTTIDFFRNRATQAGVWAITPPSLSAWHHLAFVYDGTSLGPPVIYVDGASVEVSESQDPVGSLVSESSVLVIGNHADDTVTFHGSMAHVAIWNGLLTSAEVKALSILTPPTLVRPNALAAWWPLVDGGPVERDMSGNGHHGTVSGTVGSAAGPTVTLGEAPDPDFWALRDIGKRHRPGRIVIPSV